MLNCREWVVLFMLAVIGLLVMPVECYAAVKGPCSNCHTMHNSEKGSAVAFTVDISGAHLIREQPYANLLKTDCLGCHSSIGAETILDSEGSRTPVVFNMLEPTYPPVGSTTSTLAAGNFYWVMRNGDAYGHNVHGISDEDTRFLPTLAPGGLTRTEESCGNCHGSLSSEQGGCEACHVPFHHIQSEAEVVGGEQGWYRFLGSVMQRGDSSEPPPEGVVGIEAPDWEQNPTTVQHNAYQGASGTYSSYLESGSISQKCYGCHGLYHSNLTTGSAWLRHPVDVSIPDSGEYLAVDTYNPLVPVARANVGPDDVNFFEINRGSDMVTCISCHRVHGSPYPALLRWGYRDWPGTDSHTQEPAFNGCAFCHTSKD